MIEVKLEFFIIYSRDDENDLRERVQFERQDFIVTKSPNILDEDPPSASERSFPPSVPKFKFIRQAPKPKSFSFVPPVPPRYDSNIMTILALVDERLYQSE